MNYKVLMLLCLSMTAITTFAQTDRIVVSEEVKEAIIDSMNQNRAIKALKNYDFVLEADRVNFKRGQTAHVSSGTNFIMMKGTDNVVVQVAPFNGGGPNGVGGVTVEGRASNIKLKTDKKGNRDLSMDVLGSGISATVFISLPAGGNSASATVSPNFNSDRITLYGTLIPTAQSAVFKGRSF